MLTQQLFSWENIPLSAVSRLVDFFDVALRICADISRGEKKETNREKERESDVTKGHRRRVRGERG